MSANCNKTPNEDYVFILNSGCKMKTIHYPFEFLKFRDVFIPGFAKQLKKDISQLEFEPTCSDLFSFTQTKNLINIDASPTIELFLDALLKSIAGMLSDYYNIEFNKKVTVSSSKYSQGDFLLCHDDASDDRAVAFIYYLTEEPWLKTWGGSLDLFQTINNEATHARRRIFPKFNSLLCFKVDPDVTYHQVAEITSNVDRLSINGWFHSDQFKHEPKLIPDTKLSLVQHKHVTFYSIGAHSYLTELINHNFFEPNVVAHVRREFTVEGVIIASDFLRLCTLHVLIEELENKTQWDIQGPPYKRKYDVAAIQTLPSVLRTLVHFMTSLEWFNYFESITGLDKHNIVSSSFEIQRWLPGYYTLLYYTNEHEAYDVIDVFVLINMSTSRDQSATSVIVYANSSSSEEQCDDTFQLCLLHNHIFVIRRKSTSSWFIKYLRKQTMSKFYMFQMTYNLTKKKRKRCDV